MIIEEQDLDLLYVKAIGQTILHGQKSSPRGIDTQELVSPLLILRGPKERLPMIKNKARQLNYAFQIVESLQYLDECMDPDRIIHYNKRFGSFKNWTTGEFDGAYGPRLQGQMLWCYELLKRDPDTRQAVMSIFRADQDHHESLDVPCTLTIQFLLREHLHCVVNMRSNDLLWGTPYDIMGFTTLQHAMASWLGVKAGDYFHHAGSLHIYQNTQEHLIRTLESIGEKSLSYGPFNMSRDVTVDALGTFWSLERKSRTQNLEVEGCTLPGPLSTMLDVVSRFNAKKRRNELVADR